MCDQGVALVSSYAGIRPCVFDRVDTRVYITSTRGAGHLHPVDDWQAYQGSASSCSVATYRLSADVMGWYQFLEIAIYLTKPCDIELKSPSKAPSDTRMSYRQSCDRCRQQKVRCLREEPQAVDNDAPSGQHLPPCDRCTKAGVACVYSCTYPIHVSLL